MTHTSNVLASDTLISECLPHFQYHPPAFTSESTSAPIFSCFHCGILLAQIVYKITQGKLAYYLLYTTTHGTVNAHEFSMNELPIHLL